MRKAIAAALVLVAFLVAACGSDPHKGEHCARSHTEMIWIPIVHSCGNGCVFTTPILLPTTVCDQWVPDNPATVIPATKRGN